MPVREAEQLKEVEELADQTPEPTEVPATKFSAEGDLPAVKTEAAEPQASASEQAFGPEPKAETAAEPKPLEQVPDEQKPATKADTSPLDRGMHDVEEYQAECVAAGKPDKWQGKYAMGHTHAHGWSQPYEGREAMEFHLKHGYSASQAVKDFAAGPTIADYRVIGVALEMLEVCDDIGDRKFDQLFGSKDEEEDAAVPHAQRLQITSAMYTTPWAAQMMALAQEKDALLENPMPVPEPVQENGGEDKPKQSILEEEEPVIVAEDLGKQPVREVL